MTKLITAIALPSLLATLAVGCVDDNDSDMPSETSGGHLAKYAADPFGAVPTFRPSTCQDIVDYVPTAKDGEYTLYIHNEPTYRWLVYCANMQQGTPAEYLTLQYGENSSTFASASGQVTTQYDKVRINPQSLSVDIGDKTFAVSTGSAMHNGVKLTSMPYGVAMSCGVVAKANINLRGTPFRLERQLPWFGTYSAPTNELSTDRKVNDMTMNGDCGWFAATELTKPTSTDSQYKLNLAFFR